MAQACHAAQVIIALVPIVGISFSALVIFFALLWKHTEIKLRISKNTYNPPVFNWKLFSLFAGLCLIGTGFSISVIFLIVSGITYGLLGGIIPFVLGIMFLIFYKLTANAK
ncbi:MAG: hypothetical protein MJ185_09255 [Treponema sp.]|nr:hypothetical protein [Treponema sp.]